MMRKRRLLKSVLLSLLFSTITVYSGMALALDPATVVGPEECIDCHEESYYLWQETTHYKTYEELAANIDGMGIADKMEVDDIEDVKAVCVTCHFTVTGESEDDHEVISGISCESCHGGARDWLEPHGEYPGKDASSENEEQKAARIAHAESMGLIYPQRIERIAANCLNCHTVPNEKLVNIGEHPAGSEFELVSWSQGEIRHNVYWNKGAENAESPIERRRLMYVVGRATDLQYSLLALARATGPGEYLGAMQQRVGNALAELKKIQELQNIPEVQQMINEASALALEPGQNETLKQAAANVAKQISELASQHDGAQWQPLDELLPEKYHYSEKYQ